MKQLLFISLFLILTNSYAVEDIIIGSKYIRINKVTDQALKSLNEIENKEEAVIYIMSDVTQQGFDKVCQSATWIKNFQTTLWNENISNIDAIVHLASLEILALKGLKHFKEVEMDISPLKKLIHLKEVDFYGATVKNTEILSHLINLERVSLYMSGVSNIDFLYKTPNVKDLNLYGRKHSFKNYEPVASLKKLEKLSIYMNPQATDENLMVLKKLTNLKEISLSNCRAVTSLDFVENCHQLQSIRASWCNSLADFSCMENMPHISNLELTDTKFKDIDLLAEKNSLKSLNISGTLVTELSVLKSCPNLKTLSIQKTKIQDISVLLKCDNLHSLNIGDNIPEEQVTLLKKKNTDLRIKRR